MDTLSGSLTGSFANRYTIERVLGRGATATVYLAHDSRSNRNVAIKVLKPDIAESIGTARFLREIKLTQQLKHPHIAPVLDSGEYEHKLFFVLPLMEEGSLRDRLNRERQLPVAEAVGIARTIAGALDHAHKSGIVHRDVKPENILISKDTVCLADFGIARAIERAINESSTSTGVVRGTPAYMSPEQASGEHDYDGRSDIFSLACVLYEMIAGIHAFVGPTAKIVMAQRLVHPPRPVSVYRPNVPAALEEALTRALQIQPVDRFATAGEFERALGAALKDSTPAGHRRRINRKMAVIGGGAAVVVASAIAVATWQPWKPGRAFGPKPDTTKFVVLPVEGDAAAPRGDVHNLLQESLASWKGISVVDDVSLRDARHTDAPVRNEDEAKKSAMTVGAGRFVRARLTKSGDSLRLWSGLFDSQSGSRLYETTMSLPVSLSSSHNVVSKGVDALLLRDTSVNAGSRVLPAVQRLNSGLASIEAFNLHDADSLLMASLESDPDYARAALWLAQVRNWKLDETDSWKTWAERADKGSGLTEREKHFAQALVAMGKQDYPGACRLYARMNASDDHDFSTWYGLGQCTRQDDAVIRDAKSPSGWRFRSSSQQSVTAFARAFELAPALHTNFEARAYSKIRDLLFSRRSILRRGVSTDSSKRRFLAYATVRGDTLVHIPYPEELLRRGTIDTDPAGRAAALSRQRELFRRLAVSWAAALPKSPATKEALAVSLESVGDPGAIDTLRVGRTLASDDRLRIRLAAEEVLMRVSFSRIDPSQAAAARDLADSLLSAFSSPPADLAATLAPLAVVVGKCGLAGHLAAVSASPAVARYFGVTLHAAAAAESLTVISGMGCRRPVDTLAMAGLLANATGAERDSLEYNLLGRAVVLTYPLDSSRIIRLAAASDDWILAVQKASLERNPEIVRSTLRDRRKVRPDADVTPDALYPESRAWVSIGDRQTAVAWLDPVLNRRGWLELMLNDAVGTGALVRSVALRAQLAAIARDRAAARKWAAVVSQLWRAPDPALETMRAEMVRITEN